MRGNFVSSRSRKNFHVFEVEVAGVALARGAPLPRGCTVVPLLAISSHFFDRFAPELVFLAFTVAEGALFQLAKLPLGAFSIDHIIFQERMLSQKMLRQNLAPP